MDTSGSDNSRIPFYAEVISEFTQLNIISSHPDDVDNVKEKIEALMLKISKKILLDPHYSYKSNVSSITNNHEVTKETQDLCDLSYHVKDLYDLFCRTYFKNDEDHNPTSDFSRNV